MAGCGSKEVESEAVSGDYFDAAAEAAVEARALSYAAVTGDTMSMRMKSHFDLDNRHRSSQSADASCSSGGSLLEALSFAVANVFARDSWASGEAVGAGLVVEVVAGMTGMMDSPCLEPSSFVAFEDQSDGASC